MTESIESVVGFALTSIYLFFPAYAAGTRMKVYKKDSRLVVRLLTIISAILLSIIAAELQSLFETDLLVFSWRSQEIRETPWWAIGSIFGAGAVLGETLRTYWRRRLSKWDNLGAVMGAGVAFSGMYLYFHFPLSAGTTLQFFDLILLAMGVNGFACVAVNKIIGWKRQRPLTS